MKITSLAIAFLFSIPFTFAQSVEDKIQMLLKDDNVENIFSEKSEILILSNEVCNPTNCNLKLIEVDKTIKFTTMEEAFMRNIHPLVIEHFQKIVSNTQNVVYSIGSKKFIKKLVFN